MNSSSDRCLRVAGIWAGTHRSMVLVLSLVLLSLLLPQRGSFAEDNAPPLMAIPGTANVSQGHFSYTVPIAVPPGTAGLTPILSLSYTSSGGDGFLGLGWSLQLSASSYARLDALKNAAQESLPDHSAEVSTSAPTATDQNGNVGVSAVPGPTSDPYPKGAALEFPAPIIRCPRTMAQDGVHGGVNFDSNDRFCLNGHHLFKIGSGAYGAAETQYRTEIDEFSKVIAHGQAGNGPAWFEVHTKSGQIFNFGATPDSQALYNPTYGSTEASGADGSVRAWAISKISDVQGNYLTITYNGGTQDATNGQIYPTKIEYTGHEGDISPYNSIRFYYHQRADIVPVYQAGSVLRSTKLLDEIKTFNGTTLVLDYKFAYDEASSAATHNELKSIILCDGNTPATCLPATTFGWQGSRDRLTMTALPITLDGIIPQSSGNNEPTLGKLAYGDFNGDGITDIAILLDPVEGGATNFKTHLGSGAAGAFGDAVPTQIDPKASFGGEQFRALDINGDGLEDLFYACVPGTTTYEADFYSSKGDGNFSVTGKANCGDGQLPIDIYPADVNGDSKIDYFDNAVLSTNSSEHTGQTYLGDGTVKFTHQAGDFSLGYGLQGILLADFDGDGCADRIVTASSGFGLSYSCAPAVTSISTPGNVWKGIGGSITNHIHNRPVQNNQSILGDFNGDGKTDVLTILNPQSAGDPGQATLDLSTGTGFGEFNLSDSNSAYYIAGAENWYKFNIAAGDWNGDGKTDIALIAPNYSPAFYGTSIAHQIWLSVGTGFIRAKDSSGNVVNIPNNSLDDCDGYPGCVIPEVADWNNDGASDLLLIRHSGDAQYVFSYVPELMTGVSNGIGNTTIVSYDRLNKNGTFYTKCPNSPGSYVCCPSAQNCDGSYPTQSVDSAMYVVSRIDESNGLDTCSAAGGANCYGTTYTYAGAKRDLAGRGFLGFEQIVETDLQSHIVTTENYRLDFPYIGYLASETVVSTFITPSCTASILRGTTNTPGLVALGNRTFVYTAQSVVTRHDCDGTAMPTLTTTNSYDCQDSTTCYGELTQTILTRSGPGGDGSSVTTSIGYQDDAAHWCFGRPSSKAVESVVGSSDITRTTSYSWTNCLLKQEVVEPTHPNLYAETDYTFDGYGNVKSTTISGSDSAWPVYQFASRTTKTSYDPQGQFPVSTTDELEHVDLYSYEGNFGTLVSHTDPNNVTTTWTPDTFGRPFLEDHADGTEVRHSYAYCTTQCPSPGAFLAKAKPTKASNQAQIGPLSTTYYDILGRKIAADVQGFDGGTIRASTVYDTLERVAQTSRPYFVSGGTPAWTSLTNDGLGRVVLATAPDRSTIGTNYTGLSVAVTDANGNVTTTHRNAEGKIAWVKDGLNHTTNYTYDAFDDLISVTDPADPATPNVTSYGYDMRGHLQSISDPDMGMATNNADGQDHSWTYKVDPLGEITQETDAKGQVTSYSYDLEMRLVGRTEPGLSSNWTFDTATHGVHKLDFATTGSNYTRTLTYDSLSRPITTTLKIYGTAYVYGIGYDPVTGRIATVNYPSSSSIRYVYTSLGYLSRINDGANGGNLWTVNGRDAELHLTNQTFGNGIAQSSGYDPLTGRLKTIQAGASNAVANFDYDYDLAGNLKYRDDKNSSIYEYYCYDPVNRLQMSSSAINGASAADCTTTGSNIIHRGVNYDATGNITSKTGIGTYSYPNPGQPRPHAVLSVSGNVNGVTAPSYTYDANGFMTGNSRGSVTPTSFNMTATVDDGANKRTFNYDTEHTRIQQVQTTSSASNYTTYLNDPASGAMSEKYDSGTATWRDYITVPGTGAFIAERFGQGTSKWGAVTWNNFQWQGALLETTDYFILDHIGSVAVITDDHATVVERDSYDAWGKRRNPNGTDSANCAVMSSVTRGFTGQEMMDSICTTNLNARLYDPAIAKFMAADPITASPYDLQSLNRYGYVGNNPLTRTDITGLTWNDFFAGVGAGNANFWGLPSDPYSPTSAGDYNIGHSVGMFIGAGSAAFAERGVGGGGVCCFLAGTLVTTNHGLKPIEKIHVGELVLSRSDVDKRTQYKPVLNLIRRHHREIYEVRVKAPGNGGQSEIEKFETTDDHPWRSADGRWLTTLELGPGAKIEGASGAPGEVVSVVKTGQVAKTYNLEVADYHTYFVGREQLWVHNACNIYGSRAAAARAAMRDARIPTSRPRSDVKNGSMPVPNSQRQQMTETAEGKPAVVTPHDPHPNGAQEHDQYSHVHASEAKVDDTGAPRRADENNSTGPVKYRNDGGVAAYESGVVIYNPSQKYLDREARQPITPPPPPPPPPPSDGPS